MRRPSAASSPPLAFVLALFVLLLRLCPADLVDDLDYEDDNDQEQGNKEVSSTAAGHSLVLDLSSLSVLAALKLKFVVLLLIAVAVYLLVTKGYKTQCMFGGCRPNYSTYGYYPYVDYTYVGYEVPSAAYRRPGPGPAGHHLSDLTARVWNSIDIASMAFSALNIQEDDCRRKLVCQADRAAATNPLLRAALSWFSASLSRYRTDRSRVAVNFADGIGESVGGGSEWRQGEAGDPCEELYPRCLHHDLPPVLGGPERPARPPIPVYLEHGSYAAHQHQHHHHHGHHADHVVDAWHGHGAGLQGAPGPPSSLGTLAPSDLDHRHNEYVYEYPPPLGADYATRTTSSAHNTDAQPTQALLDDSPGHDAVLTDEASTASATVLAPLRMDASATKNPDVGIDVFSTVGAGPSAASNLVGASLSASSALPAIPPGPVVLAATAGKSGTPETSRERWGPEDQGALEHRHRDLQPQGAAGAVDREDRGARRSGVTPTSALPPDGVISTAEPSPGPPEPALNVTMTPQIWRRVLFRSEDRIKFHRD